MLISNIDLFYMDYLAVDFGSITTKVARLSNNKKGKFKLESLGIAQTPLGGVVSGNQATLERVAEMLIKLRLDAKISAKKVVASIPESEIFTKLIRFPKMSMDELSSAVTYEAEQYIPLPIQDVNYSYTIGAERPDGAIDVLIVAAPIKLIERYEKVLSMAGLEAVAIDTELIALSRSVISMNDAGSNLIVDIGARTTDFAVVLDGRVVFSRSISVGGGAMTRALVNGLQIDETQAEQFKRSYGLLDGQLEGKVATVLKQVAQTIAVELSRTVNYYVSKSSQNINTIKLAGGGSALPGLVTYLSEFLPGEIQLADVLARIEQDERLAGLENLSQYAIVLGLAMKEL